MQSFFQIYLNDLRSSRTKCLPAQCWPSPVSLNGSIFTVPIREPGRDFQLPLPSAFHNAAPTSISARSIVRLRNHPAGECKAPFKAGEGPIFLAQYPGGRASQKLQKYHPLPAGRGEPPDRPGLNATLMISLVCPLRVKRFHCRVAYVPTDLGPCGPSLLWRSSFAIGAKRHARNNMSVHLEDDRILSGRHVPDLHRRIRSGGSEHCLPSGLNAAASLTELV